MNQVQIKYGVVGRYRDITKWVIRFCVIRNTIYIPKDDSIRAHVFGDHLYGIYKHIILKDNVNGIERRYEHNEDIEYELNFVIIVDDEKELKWEVLSAMTDVETKIKHIHDNIKMVGGSLRDELNEQYMVLRYLDPKSKVLELGSNIGRNTCVIASILEDESNFVTCESDPVSVEVLRKNRFLNRFHFEIEDSALSYKKLIQKNWVTIPSEEVLEGYFPVKTITFEELEEKYQIQFDTLVADCEGALYYICKDNENILNNIKTIILESDFFEESHKRYIMEIFEIRGFRRVYSEPLRLKMTQFPQICRDSFYEVWIRE